MPRYRVRSVNRSGKRIVAVVVAPDALSAQQMHSDKGWTVLATKRARTHRRQQRRLEKAMAVSGGVLFHQLGELLAAGVSVRLAVGEVTRLAPVGMVAKTWSGLLPLLDEGVPLVSAMEHFPGLLAPRHLAMLRAGHSQDDLARSLTDVGGEMAWRSEQLQRWQRLSAYPLFSLALLSLVCVFLMIEVVPGLRPLLLPMADELPWVTQNILHASDTMSDFVNRSTASLIRTLIPPIAGLLLLLLIMRWMTKFRPIRNRWLRSGTAQRWVWPFSVAVHAQTVHLLLKQNIALPQAVNLAAPAAAWFGTLDAWERVARRVTHDGLFADALRSAPEIPELYGSLVHVGEQHGTLDKSTAMATEVFHQRFGQQLQRVDVMIGPVLLLMAGALIVAIFVWVILPVYDLVVQQGALA